MINTQTKQKRNKREKQGKNEGKETEKSPSKKRLALF